MGPTVKPRLPPLCSNLDNTGIEIECLICSRRVRLLKARQGDFLVYGSHADGRGFREWCCGSFEFHAGNYDDYEESLRATRLTGK